MYEIYSNIMKKMFSGFFHGFFSKPTYTRTFLYLFMKLILQRQKVHFYGLFCKLVLKL